MRFDSPLEDIFTNRSHIRVLGALYRLPEGLAASGREIARRARVSHPTALRAIGALVETGLVTAVRHPAANAYELNRCHLFADQIEELLRTEYVIGRTLVSFLQDEILARTDKVEWATIFGSAAWGESTPTSDIDLAVSCKPASAGEVQEALERVSEAAQRKFGNRVSPLINTRLERPSTRIWKRIDQEGISLIRSGRAVRP